MFAQRPRTQTRTALGQLEALESRVNLSTFPLAPATSWHAPIQTQAIGKLATPKVLSLAGVGATALTTSTTTVPLASYSSIWNCKLETRPSGQDIGYVSTSGAYVEYEITALSAGTYQLSLGFAATGGAKSQISVNGTAVGTLSIDSSGSWDSYKTYTQALTLSAGVNTIRIGALGGTQYNLNALSVTPATAATPPVANTYPVSSTATTAIPVTGYSSISNCRVEYQSGIPDIGYVSTAGAYVEYTLSVPASGSYNLSLGLAAISKATLNVYTNGQLANTFDVAATGSWTSYAALTKSIYLSAGTTVLRMASANGTQYNINAISLASAAQTSPTPTPTPTPVTNPVKVTTTWMNSFTQLNITGTSGNDSIVVSQSGGTITVTANGQTSTYSDTYGNIVIHSGAGNDAITVDSSVTIATLAYTDTGADTVKNFTRGKATIVSIGNGADVVYGNGINTSFWVDYVDSVAASSSETSAGRVHRILTFYNNVGTSLSGQNLADPAGSGTTTRLTNASLWGTGPVADDVVQGQLPDCYVNAPLAGLATFNASRLQESAVDLGDGTYAVQFVRNRVLTYVRVDGDLPAGGPYADGLRYAHPGSSGNIWAAIIEKAYAVFRNNANSYTSLNYGLPNVFLNEINVANTIFTPTDAASAYTAISAALAQNRAVVFGTASTITGGAPLAPSHAYTVLSVAKDSAGTVVFTLRNPWGFDGAGNDSNPSDGIVRITFAQFLANNYVSAIVS